MRPAETKIDNCSHGKPRLRALWVQLPLSLPTIGNEGLVVLAWESSARRLRDFQDKCRIETAFKKYRRAGS